MFITPIQKFPSSIIRQNCPLYLSGIIPKFIKYRTGKRKRVIGTRTHSFRWLKEKNPRIFAHMHFINRIYHTTPRMSIHVQFYFIVSILFKPNNRRRAHIRTGNKFNCCRLHCPFVLQIIPDRFIRKSDRSILTNIQWCRININLNIRIIYHNRLCLRQLGTSASGIRQSYRHIILSQAFKTYNRESRSSTRTIQPFHIIIL